jgi:hypothetical protein
MKKRLQKRNPKNLHYAKMGGSRKRTKPSNYMALKKDIGL